MRQEMSVPAPRDLPSGRLIVRKEHLMRELTLQEKDLQPAIVAGSGSGIGGATGPPRRPWWRERWVLAALVPAIIVAAAAATYIVVNSADEVAASIGCHDRADRHANVTVGNSDGRDPVAVCTDLWRQGIVSHGSTSAPAMFACAIGQGAVGVFPVEGNKTCADLGLSPLPAGYVEAAKKFAGLRDALVGQFTRAGCVDEATARAMAERELAARGFAGWTVATVRPFTDAEPCALLGFDLAKKTLLLIPSDTSKDIPIG
jgi:hypothetical protein